MDPKLKALIDKHVGPRYGSLPGAPKPLDGQAGGQSAAQTKAESKAEETAEKEAVEGEEEQSQTDEQAQTNSVGAGTQIHSAIKTRFPVLVPPTMQAPGATLSSNTLIRQIIKKGCELSRRTEYEIIQGKGRRRPVARVRQAIAYIIAVRFDGTPGAQGIVGKALQRDHTTIRHSIFKITELRQGRTKYDDDITALELVKQLSEHFNIPLPDPEAPPPAIATS